MLTFVGHVVDAQGLRPNPDSVNAIRRRPQPSTKKELQRFLGSLNFYHRFVQGAANLQTPLYVISAAIKKRRPAHVDRHRPGSLLSLSKGPRYLHSLGAPISRRTCSQMHQTSPSERSWNSPLTMSGNHSDLFRDNFPALKRGTVRTTANCSRPTSPRDISYTRSRAYASHSAPITAPYCSCSRRRLKS